MAAAVGSALSIASAVAAGQQTSPFAGLWQGTLHAGAMSLRLGLTVTDSAGAPTATLTSIDQGNAKIPATAAVAGDTLRVAMPAINATYVATLSGDSLRGTFTQGAPFPLVMGRTGGFATVNHPQTPRPPFPYSARDVSVHSAAGVTLACTELLPAGQGPFAAAVFITGSGPQDRDEALLGHQPFLVVADYLARQGIASLRCDDRGTAKSTGSFASATSADFATDADSTFEFLRRQPGIAANKVGLIGHSEGGLIAPMVAQRDPHVAFVVLMAGPGLRGDSILILQEEKIAAANGVPLMQVAMMVSANRRLFNAILAASDSADAARRFQAVSDSIVAAVPEQAKQQATTQLEQAKGQLLSPWFRYFIAYDPLPALRALKVPVLAINGTLDLQVPYEEDLGAIDSALKVAGNRDYRVVPLEGLNHLFQPATTGSPSEYSTIETTIAPVALDTIASWINARFGGSR